MPACAIDDDDDITDDVADGDEEEEEDEDEEDEEEEKERAGCCSGCRLALLGSKVWCTGSIGSAHAPTGSIWLASMMPPPPPPKSPLPPTPLGPLEPFVPPTPAPEPAGSWPGYLNPTTTSAACWAATAAKRHCAMDI